MSERRPDFKTLATRELRQRGYEMTDDDRGYSRWQRALSVVERTGDGWHVWWLSESKRFPHELISATADPTIEWLIDQLPYAPRAGTGWNDAEIGASCVPLSQRSPESDGGTT